MSGFSIIVLRGSAVSAARVRQTTGVRVGVRARARARAGVGFDAVRVSAEEERNQVKPMSASVAILIVRRLERRPTSGRLLETAQMV